MCTRNARAFVTEQLRREDVEGKRVLEVGSYDYNGSTRAGILTWDPASYLGVDIQEGPGVDEVCNVADLLSRFGPDAFDVVVTTEMLEHVQDWQGAVENLKGVLAPGGVLVLTTRSKGFGFHGYPHDFWRYEQADMKVIFNDFDIETLESDDPAEPGVFVRARKPVDRREPAVPLDNYALHSVILNRRALKLPVAATAAVRVLTPAWYGMKKILPPSVVTRAKKLTGRGGVSVG